MSGVSAGAYMAAQYHVAHASTVDGAGLVAGGPWGCALGQIDRALGACMGGNGLDIGLLVTRAEQLAAAGAIDPLPTLGDDSVYLFHGSNDAIVAAGVTAAAADWYRAVAPSAALAIVDDVPAAHGWPTLDAGGPCDSLADGFVNACDYDTAGELLGHLLGDLEPPEPGEAGIESFSQAPYAATGLANEGYVYVPASCRQQVGCRVHVFFHGCRQSADEVGTALIEQSGLLRWADSNDLVLLFPQVAASRVAPVNPLACWDWWGYGGENYLARDGAQLAAVRAMIEQLQSR